MNLTLMSVSAFNDTANAVVSKLGGIIGGWPLMIMLLACGLLLTIRLRGLQVRRLGAGFKLMFEKKGPHAGEISSFQALCTALSATIGTGNIVGVATAICIGGPGALFWMIVAAFFGIATKFAECMLAVRYRSIAPDGHVLGGPFYYIEKGMGPKWKWLGKLFAVFGVLAGLFGIGTITQINGISSAIRNFFDPNFDGTTGLSILGTHYSWAVVLGGLFVTICVALVVIGGLKRISGVAQIIVPFMAITYVVFCLILIVCNISALPAAVALIVRAAFNPAAATGGAVGSIFLAMQKGVARGIFSNEAGLGSAPIAAAAAATNDPVKQGLVSMLGTFIDTIVICTMTGLAIVMTGAWRPELGLEGVSVTTYAFCNGLPFPSVVSSFVLMVCLTFFAFTTILGWDYYSERCLEYLTGGKTGIVSVYRWVYILMVFVGPYLTVSFVWNAADVFNTLMAFPNLIALFALSGVAAKEVRAYLHRDKLQ